jgi:hypothetical protein
MSVIYFLAFDYKFIFRFLLKNNLFSGYVGDPFVDCQLEPCSQNPCGSNAECDSKYSLFLILILKIFVFLLKLIGPLNCLYFAVKSIFSINLRLLYLIFFLLDSKQRQNSYMQMPQGPHWRSLQQMLTRSLLVKSLW